MQPGPSDSAAVTVLLDGNPVGEAHGEKWAPTEWPASIGPAQVAEPVVTWCPAVIG